MTAWRGSLAQRTSLALGVFYIVSGVAGLIVNPDFGTGADTSSKLLLVDWNGWHAVLTLALVPAALWAATRPAWATGFLAYNAFVNAVTAVWALIDSTPLGILDLPHVGIDFVTHVVIAALSAGVVVVEARRGTSRTSPVTRAGVSSAP